MSNFAQGLAKQMADEDTSVASEGLGLAEFSDWIDTGCLLLNGVMSGSLYGGVADNKITVFAGDSACGKTFFILTIVKNFLDTYKDSVVVYYDTEYAVTKEMMETRGIDITRVILSSPSTVQDCKTKMLKMLENYMGIKEATRPKMMMILDSLGQLSTSKEVEDSGEGKETKDMTKAGQVGGLFRTVTPKLARAKVPLLIANHTYTTFGYIPGKEMSGGASLKYNSSTTCFISKSKDKDGKDVVGNLIKVKMVKSRLSRENREVTLKLSYDTGLDKHYGLLNLAETAGIFKKVSTQYQLPDGTKAFGKHIEEAPEKYFTPDVMKQLEEFCNVYFTYGKSYDQTIE